MQPQADLQVSPVATHLPDRETPDSMGRKIAERYAAEIPMQDRVLPNIVASKRLGYLASTIHLSTTGPLSSNDRLGNLPNIVNDAMNTHKTPQAIILALRACADDPMQYIARGGGGKLGQYFYEGPLPQSVKDAAAQIALCEGDHTTSDTMRIIANRIEAALAQNATMTVNDAVDIITTSKKEFASQEKASDDVRVAAARHLIEILYPGYFESPQFNLLIEKREMVAGNRKTKETPEETDSRLSAVLMTAKTICGEEAWDGIEMNFTEAEDREDKQNALDRAIERAVHTSLVQKYSNNPS